jgi:hypothetical protein
MGVSCNLLRCGMERGDDEEGKVEFGGAPNSGKLENNPYSGKRLAFGSGRGWGWDHGLK